MKIQKLLKFGKREHLTNLLEGHVYINHASFFKKDIDHGMYDIHEGQERIIHLKNAVLNLKTPDWADWKTLNLNSGKIEAINDLSNAHIYSFFQISEEETLAKEYFKLSDDIKKMGEFFLVINNPKLFIERLDNVLNTFKFEFSRGTIEYYDSGENQANLTAYNKRNNFEYQKEFRYIIESNTRGPLLLDIGSISEISELYETSKVNGLIFLW